MIELIGLVATFVTVLSMTFHSQRKLRITNLIACFIWIVYGIFINSVSVILVNSIVAGIHLVWFYKNKTKRIMTQTEWNKERDKMAENEKLDPEYMYKWIKQKSGK